MEATNWPTGSYGWRARLGMLKPSLVIDNNAHEFYLMAPPGVELFVTSLGVNGMRDSEYEKAISNIEVPLKLLLRFEPDSLVQAGVPPIATRGWAFEDEVMAVVRQHTDIPYFTDTAASTQALLAMSCRRILLVSYSFDDGLCAQIGDYLDHFGIEVAGISRVADRSSADSALLALEEVYRTVRMAFAGSGADGVWITQASMPSIGVIEALEADLGVPVVSSAQAMMWAGLRAAGVQEAIPDRGRLLRSENGPSIAGQR